MRDDIRAKRPRQAAPQPASPKARTARVAEPDLHELLVPEPRRVQPTPRPPAELPRTPSRRLWLRRALTTAGIFLLCLGIGAQARGQTESLKGDVVGNINVAKEAAKAARGNLEAGRYADAEDQFGMAKAALHSANQALAARGQFGGQHGSIGQGQIGSGTQLLASVELLADSGQQISRELRAVNDQLTASGNDPLKAGEAVIARAPQLRQVMQDADSRVALLEQTVRDTKRAGSGGELGTIAADLEEGLLALRQATSNGSRLAAALPQLLGSDHFRQYLLWFQNPAELRASGGFIGTYGRLTLDQGKVNELLIDSIYSPANQANSIREIAPAPYGRFYGGGQSVWGMQDSNWSPDFPTAAAKFQYFYERGGGPTTDGVIAITINPIIEILKVVGPVEMPEYDYVLTADNFHALIQNDQLARVGETDPKKTLRDFAPKLLTKIGAAEPAQRQAVYRIMVDATATGDLQLHFANDDLQRLVADSGSDGRLTIGDTGLSVVDTNIGGGKSSIDIETEITQTVRIAEDGTATTTVEHKRRHTAAYASSTTNQNFTRFFVPAGSQLEHSEGFEDYDQVSAGPEDGVTAIGGWTSVGPNEERISKVVYRLPHKVKLSDGYFPVRYYKQPGTKPTVRYRVELPSGYRWTNTEPAFVDGRTAEFTITTDRDVAGELHFTKD